MRRSSLLAAIPAMALVVAGTVSTAAQEEDTEANRQLTPELCQAEPRSEEELIAAFGLDAASADEAPVIPRAEIAIPLGQPAPDEVIRGVTDTIREFFACNNAGDVPRTTALLSESGILRFYGFGPRDEALDQQFRAWAAGETTPREESEYIRLVAVTDVSILADGRVAAFVINNEPLLPPRGAETLLFVFSQADDGGWLVDDYYDFTIIAPDSGDAGTPATE